MKNLIAFNLMISVIFLFILGCGSQDNLKEDAKKIGDAMCRSLDVMNRLRSADPTDTALISKLSTELTNIQTEMATMYEAFNAKWGEKAKEEGFIKSFKKELHKTMVECKSLSEEDRATFLKELEE